MAEQIIIVVDNGRIQGIWSDRALEVLVVDRST